MKTLLLVSFACWLFAPAPGLCQDDPGTSEPDSGLVLVVQIGSRLYPDWSEEQRLRLHEMFYLGDTEYTARIERFVPDFRMGDGGKILNYSDELKNPAAQVIVYHDTTAADTSWAFLNFPPHFSPRAFFTFQLKEVLGYEAGSVPISAKPVVETKNESSPEDSVATKRKEDDHE
jgi:hypothetical protein